MCMFGMHMETFIEFSGITNRLKDGIIMRPLIFLLIFKQYEEIFEKKQQLKMLEYQVNKQ